MEYREIEMDLFDLPAYFTLAHCIATDAIMGSGIAIEFSRRFPRMKVILQEDLDFFVGDVVHYYDSYSDRTVLNLVTKSDSYGKPTRGSFNKTIVRLKEACRQLNVKHLGIPKIGSGKDRLSWKKSSQFIKEVFEDTDIEIIVCIK